MSSKQLTVDYDRYQHISDHCESLEYQVEEKDKIIKELKESLVTLRSEALNLVNKMDSLIHKS